MSHSEPRTSKTKSRSTHASRHILAIADTVRKNVTIDWTLRENVQAKLRVMVKRILRKHGYPPDKQKKATDTVLEQATIIAKDWAEPKPL